jgi:hypothetical protein
VRPIARAASLRQLPEREKHRLKDGDPCADLLRVPRREPLDFFGRPVPVLPEIEQGANFTDMKAQRTRPADEAQAVDVALVVRLALGQQPDGQVVAGPLEAEACLSCCFSDVQL